MNSLGKSFVAAACLFGWAQIASAQQGAVQPQFPGVTADGMLLAQNDAAIERARLQRDATPPVSVGVDANGMALPTAEVTDSKDASFGTQMLVKEQEPEREFTLNGSASIAWTDNVALTRRGERDDVFGIWNANLGWSHRLTSDWTADLGGRVSVFRYDRTPGLDFDDFGFGAGLSWTPKMLRGVTLFGRYDFTELLARGGDQILMEHALTVGAQKAIALGRSHGLLVGLSGTAAVADPAAAQREQIAAFISYHLQLARDLDADFYYRPAVHFYTSHGHTDFNQIVSLNVRYHINRWAELDASLSYGFNRSDRPAFDYNALTTAAVIGVTIRF